MYYDKTPSQIQLIGLLKPKEFDLISFYCFSIYNCTLRNYNTQIDEIEKLKTEKGKKGRFKKLLENIHQSKSLMLNECVSSQDFDEFYNKLKFLEFEIEKNI